MIARVRSAVGRTATVAGAAALGGGLATDAVTVPGALAAAVTAGLGLMANRSSLLRAPDSVRATAITVYTVPHAGCVALLVAERLAPDGATSLLVQTGLALAWTGATWLLRPGKTARALAGEAAAQEAAEADGTQTSAEVAVPDHTGLSPQARWWAQEMACEDGIAPGTVLLDHQQVGEQCVALVIGSARRGHPVPEISTSRLSAVLDMPADQIASEPVPGRGAGVRLLVLGTRPGPRAEDIDVDAEMWKQIAAEAMPGVELVETNVYPVKELN